METNEVDSPTEVTNGATTIGIPHRDLSVQPPASAAEFFKKAEEKGELQIDVVTMYIHIRTFTYVRSHTYVHIRGRNHSH